MGGQVYAGSGEDTIVREYVKAVQPNSPLQVAQQGRIKRGAQGWGNLTDAQRQDWTEKAAAFGIKTKSARRQKPTAMRPENWYTSLSAKFLACTPGGTVPANPPATKFQGDTATFTIEATTGAITVTASGANKTGVKTEILLQRLAAGYRKPTTNGYRSKAYVAFDQHNLSTTLSVTPGAYSVAVQFVNAATGETSGFQVLGSLTVALALEDGGLSDGLKQAA